MVAADAFLQATDEERRAVAMELLSEPSGVKELVRQLNDNEKLANSLASGIAAGMDVSYTFEPDLSNVVGALQSLNLDRFRNYRPEQLSESQLLLAFDVVCAFAFHPARPAISMEAISRRAEEVHARLVAFNSHTGSEKHLAEAMRQLDIADALVGELAKSNAAALEKLAEVLAVNIDASKGVVAAGEPGELVDEKRRQFIGGAIGILATLGIGSVAIASSRRDSDKQIDSSSRDTDRVVDALNDQNATVSQQQEVIESLSLALREATEALLEICGGAAAP